MIWMIASFLITGLFGIAQEPPLLTIAQAKENRNRDTVPDRLGQVVRVRGVVTAGTGDLRSEMLEIVIQDDSGGIYLFNSKPPENYQRGELLEVVGTVGQYRGKEQIPDCTIKRLGHAPLPPPVTRPFDDDQMEAFSGMLISTEGEVRVIVPQSNADYITLGVGSQQIAVFVARGSRIQKWDESKWPVGSRVRVTGVRGQYDPQPPYDSGYQLQPFLPGQVELLSQPPLISQKELLRSAAIALVVSLIFGAWILTLRLQLRRRTEELRIANERIVAAERLEAVVRTAATLNHEINNPLASIMAAADLCLMKEQLQPSAVEKIQTIKEMTSRISTSLRKLSHLTAEVRLRDDWAQGYIDIDKSR